MPGTFNRKCNEYESSGKPVKLVFYAGENSTQISDSEVYVYLGTIRYIDDDLLVFEHIKTESDRMQIIEESLNLNLVNIWSISPLKEGFDPSVYVSCPHCGEGINLLSLKDESYK